MSTTFSTEFNRQAAHTGDSIIKWVFKWIGIIITAAFNFAKEIFHTIIGR